MTEPTFLVVGAQKAGTSWLHAMLREHPEIFVTTPKSVHFFDKPERYARGLGWYRRRFKRAARYRARGEFTPNYFWEEHADDFAEGSNVAERVRAAFPEARILVTLREPVDRAVSAYFHHIRQGRVKPTQSLLDVKDEHGILSMGYYDEHLERWRASFPEDRLMVLLYESDIAKNREQTLQRVFRFVGVNEAHRPRHTARRYNARKSHLYTRLAGRHPVLAATTDLLLPGGWKNHPRFKIVVTDQERKELAKIYEPHNARLAEMLGCDLPWPARVRATRAANG